MGYRRIDEFELGTDSEEASALFRVLLKSLSGRDITFIITHTTRGWHLS